MFPSEYFARTYFDDGYWPDAVDILVAGLCIAHERILPEYVVATRILPNCQILTNIEC